MIQLAPNHLQTPAREGGASERRLEADPKISLTSTAKKSADALGVKKLLSELQEKFADAPDIAALIESEVQSRTADLYRRANYDALTHLPNRAHFHEIMEKMIQQANDTGETFSLLFLDLDGFKQVNDLQGHHIGDELLRHVSARLIASVREGDVVSRLGGDEFVVLLSDTEDRDIVETVCRRMIDEVSRPYWFDDQEVHTSTSIGVANFPQDAQVSADLVENADAALYAAKSEGKQTFRFYSDVETAVERAPEALQADFDAAVGAGQLTPWVQPQVDLKQNRIVGGCVRLDWQNPALASQFGDWSPLMAHSVWQVPVAKWLLDTACHYLAQWQAFDAEFVVTVPVMQALWSDESWLTDLEAKLDECELSKNQLQLAFSLKDLTAQTDLPTLLKTLSDQGFQLTLTELGSAPLDLAVLSQLQVQEFKFDADWLQRNMQSDAGKLWVQAVIQMVSGLDASMIAYGVNSEAEACLLSKWGCSLAQGAYWSDAMPMDTFSGLLA